MRWTIQAAATLFMAAFAAAAADTTPSPHRHGDHLQEELAVEAAWSPAAPPSARMRALYFTLVNRSASPVILIKAESPAFAAADLHRSSVADGLAVMSELAQVAVPAGDRLVLAPGGLHVMLSGAKRRLDAGDSFPLTLHFDGRAPLTVSVPVIAPGDRPTGTGHDGHQM